MSNTPHALAQEFPNDLAVLHDLKMGSAHFVTLAERYHDVNDEVHRAESGVETPSDVHLETLKKKRLALLDEIGVMIAAAKKS